MVEWMNGCINDQGLGSVAQVTVQRSLFGIEDWNEIAGYDGYGKGGGTQIVY